MFEADAKTTYLICYEVLYGELTRKMIYAGAEVLFIGANESWIKDIFAAKQFTDYARIRAIETRRYVCKSSNDGVSAIINERGEIMKKMAGFEKGVLTSKVFLSKEKTFFVIYGDLLSAAAMTLVIAGTVLLIFLRVKASRKSAVTSEG